MHTGFRVEQGEEQRVSRIEPVFGLRSVRRVSLLVIVLLSAALVLSLGQEAAAQDSPQLIVQSFWAYASRVEPGEGEQEIHVSLLNISDGSPSGHVLRIEFPPGFTPVVESWDSYSPDNAEECVWYPDDRQLECVSDHVFVPHGYGRSEHWKGLVEMPLTPGLYTLQASVLLDSQVQDTKSWDILVDAKNDVDVTISFETVPEPPVTDEAVAYVFHVTNLSPETAAEVWFFMFLDYITLDPYPPPDTEPLLSGVEVVGEGSCWVRQGPHPWQPHLLCRLDDVDPSEQITIRATGVVPGYSHGWWEIEVVLPEVYMWDNDVDGSNNVLDLTIWPERTTDDPTILKATYSSKKHEVHVIGLVPLLPDGTRSNKVRVSIPARREGSTHTPRFHCGSTIQTPIRFYLDVLGDKFEGKEELPSWLELQEADYLCVATEQYGATETMLKFR